MGTGCFVRLRLRTERAELTPYVMLQASRVAASAGEAVAAAAELRERKVVLELVETQVIARPFFLVQVMRSAA
jgi:hypothetical protein